MTPRFPPPPLAPRGPHLPQRHGEEYPDDQAWPRLPSSEVEDWLAREEEYAREVLAPLELPRLRLYEELLGRHRQAPPPVAVRRGGFLYYSREPGARSRPLHCRRRDEPGAPEEVLLDENGLAEGRPAFRLGAFVPGPDQRLLLFGVDDTGGERFTLRVKDLETGQLLDDEVTGASGCVAWAADGRSFFYTALDASSRPDRLFRHALGTPSSEDVLLFHEEDEAFHLRVDSTESQAFVRLVSACATSSEVYLLPAGHPRAPLRRVLPRRPGIRYDVTHSGEGLYLLTNDEAPRFRVLVAPARGDGPWRELVPQREHVVLCRMLAFAHHLVLLVRQEGLLQLEVVDLRGQTGPQLQRVLLSDIVHHLAPVDGMEFHGTTLRFIHSSPRAPESLLDYDMDSHRLTWVTQRSVPGHAPRDYEVTRLMATARDGERIPLTLIHHRRLQLNGRNPVVLQGYGASGRSLDPGFSAERLSLLNKGILFAIAHVRGGGEPGQHWQDEGRLANKHPSVLDFIACAEHLVSAGYTAPGLIAAMGEGAGGMLVGATVNLSPELFGAILVEHPFAGPVETLPQEDEPLTPSERKEWSGPNEPPHHGDPRLLSPRDHGTCAPYPAMLVTAALMNSRVPLWAPLRWVARLRAATSSSSPVVLHLRRYEGLARASNLHVWLWELSLRYAFILEHLCRPQR